MPVTIRVLIATDLHQQGVLYKELAATVDWVRPDALVLGGDFLHGTGMMPYGQRPWFSLRQCALALQEMPCRKVFIRGNHEDQNWLDFCDHWPVDALPEKLNGEAVRIGPLRLMGFPCSMGDPVPFSGGIQHDLSSVLPEFWLDERKAPYFWVMHEPPTDTCLTVPGTPTEGHPWWRLSILAHQPALVVCGHDHHTPTRSGRWHDRIGQTLVVNAGQNMDGPLHATLAEAEFVHVSDPLPTSLSVTHLAWSETLLAI
jgi:Icc-related predicted phosphoesterase